MINRLRNIVDIKINSCDDIDIKTRYLLIKKLLEDDDCFLKVDTKIGYRVLFDLGFNESEVLEIYDELVFGGIL